MRLIHVLAAVAIALLAPQMAVGDGQWIPTGEVDIYGNVIKTNTADNARYQYLVSGNPETAVTANSSTREQEDGVSFATGTISTPTSAISVEARYRTWLESEGTDVDSTKFYGSVIIVF